MEFVGYLSLIGIGIVLSTMAIFLTRKWIVPWIPEDILFGDSILVTKRGLILVVFSLLAIASSLIILLNQEWSLGGDQGKQRLKFLLPASFTTGILGGFVGAGSSILILPSLIIFAGLPFKIALGTTLLVIGFNSLLGFLGDVMNYAINWLFLLMITSLATVGMILGNLYSRKIPVDYLRLSFGWTMLITDQMPGYILLYLDQFTNFVQTILYAQYIQSRFLT